MATDEERVLAATDEERVLAATDEGWLDTGAMRREGPVCFGKGTGGVNRQDGTKKQVDGTADEEDTEEQTDETISLGETGEEADKGIGHD